MTAAPLRFRSEARSHPGHVRAHNEDGFLDRPERALWAVADGMGGHEQGAAASALVIGHLAALGPFDSGFAFINGVEAALTEANAALVARRAALGAITGATVVALLIHERHAACLWAGDSRAYHLNGGVLRLLTRDHSLLQALQDGGGLRDLAASPPANLITRAVGAADTLDLERGFIEVAPGDRFLLCSDGLTGVVEEDEISALLQDVPIAEGADRLLARALAAGAPDNVTLIIAEASLRG